MNQSKMIALYNYDQPSDQKERLSSHGFMVEEAEAIMGLDLENAPEIFAQPVHHHIRRIVDPEKLVDVQAVLKEKLELCHRS